MLISLQLKHGKHVTFPLTFLEFFSLLSKQCNKRVKNTAQMSHLDDNEMLIITWRESTQMLSLQWIV